MANAGCMCTCAVCDRSVRTAPCKGQHLQAQQPVLRPHRIVLQIEEGGGCLSRNQIPLSCFDDLLQVVSRQRMGLVHLHTRRYPAWKTGAPACIARSSLRSSTGDQTNHSRGRKIRLIASLHMRSKAGIWVVPSESALASMPST